MHSRFHVYCCARLSDTDRLQTDLAASPEIANGKVGLTVLWNQAAASSAYSQAIHAATSEIVVFAHCDVYFPANWFERLAWEVDRLSRLDSSWAVAGISSKTSADKLIGRIFDTSLEPVFPKTSGVFGSSLTTPVRIVSADELVLIVRRASGVSFDPLLPEFHLYGTDIILEAEKQGKGAYGLDMPLIHNAKAQLRLGPDYVRAYRFMVRKWRARLPVPTTCVPLMQNLPLLHLHRLKARYRAICRPSTYSTQRLSDPGVKARELGFPQLLAAPLCQTMSDTTSDPSSSGDKPRLGAAKTLATADPIPKSGSSVGLR
jgi:hypothetical protein